MPFWRSWVLPACLFGDPGCLLETLSVPCACLRVASGCLLHISQAFSSTSNCQLDKGSFCQALSAMCNCQLDKNTFVLWDCMRTCSHIDFGHCYFHRVFVKGIQLNSRGPIRINPHTQPVLRFGLDSSADSCFREESRPREARPQILVYIYIYIIYCLFPDF